MVTHVALSLNQSVPSPRVYLPFWSTTFPTLTISIAAPSKRPLQEACLTSALHCYKAGECLRKSESQANNLTSDCHTTITSIIMARTYAATVMVSNPYPQPKEMKPIITNCEVCERQILTKDWHGHKNSKGHRKNEEAALTKENKEANDQGNDTPGDAWNAIDVAGGDSNAFGDTAWGNSGFSNTNDNGGFDGGATSGNARKFNGACYGCGQEGHSKRDCPQSGGNRGCFNCGQAGYDSFLYSFHSANVSSDTIRPIVPIRVRVGAAVTVPVMAVERLGK